MRALAVIATLALLSTILVSSAAAQGPPVTLEFRLELDEGDRLLVPEAETATGTLSALVHIPPGTVCLEPLSITFALKSWPSYATIVIEEPKQDLVIQPSPMPQVYEVQSRFQVGVARYAPAYQAATYTFRAELFSASLQQGCFPQSGQADTSILIQNGYVPGIRVGEATVSHHGLSGKIMVPIQNLANGPTRVRTVFEGTDMTMFEQLNVNEVVLESPSVSGSSAVEEGTIVISYLLKGVEEANVGARFVAAHDLIASEASEVDSRFIATGELPAEDSESAEPNAMDSRDAAAVPGPPVLLLMLVGAGLLAITRRRRW